ncbi:MAG: PilN domain-containing protein [Candidatus Sumerlaeia bacterium]
MIKINLLPPELQSKKKGASAKAPKGPTSPKTVQLLIGLVALAFLAAWVLFGYFFAYAKITDAQDRADIVQAKVKKLEKSVENNLAQYKNEYEQWKVTQEQLEIVNELMPEDRILWSAKLNMLANMVPQDIYLVDIELDENIKLVETEQSKKDRAEYEKRKKEVDAMEEGSAKTKAKRELGEEPEVRKKPLITQTLTVKAVTELANLGTNRLQKVIEFREAMQNASMENAQGETIYFRDHFTQTGERDTSLKIEPGVMTEEILDGVPVWSFELKLTTQR